MSGFALFQMWEPYRRSLIKRRLFYVEQARKRLLSQFDDIEADADRAAQEWLEQSSQHFDPDHHDSGDFYERSHDIGIELYGLLSDMREQTRLSLVAGMFHEWDKQLREWLVRELLHGHRGENATSKVWSVDFSQLVDLLESFGWEIRGSDYFRTIEACRLVVNVYKHGNGKSFDDLRDGFPEYLDDPFSSVGGALSGVEYRDHTHLKVSDDQFQAFSDAILAFWCDVPENVVDSPVSDLPAWFDKAILKDRAKPQETNKK